MQAQGWNTWLGWGEEVTYGTPVPPTKHYRIRSEGLMAKQEQMAKDLLGTRSQFASVRSKVSVEGTIALPFIWNGGEFLLKHALGRIATTGVGPFTHVIDLRNALPVGMTLDVYRDAASTGGATDQFRYSGCQFTKLTLTQEMEDFLMLEFEVLGKSMTKVAATAPTFDAFTPAEYYHITTATLGGTSLPVRQFTLEIDNALFADKYTLVGGRTRTGIIPGGVRQVTGSFEIEYNDSTFHDMFTALTSQVISIVFTSGSQTLTIALPKAYLNGDDPVAGGPEPAYITIPFQGFYSAADNDELVITSVTTAALT